MDKKPLIGNERMEEAPKETSENLHAMIAAYTRAKDVAVDRKNRMEELMKRKSALKWDASKKQQMVRRYMVADSTVTEAISVIDQLEHRLSQITTA